MSTGLGAISKAAFKKDPKQSAYPKADWGANDIAAGDQIPFLSESISSAVEKEFDNTLQGGAGRVKADTVAKSATGGLVLQARYNNVGRLSAMAMGFENPNDAGATYHGSPETVSGKSKHVLELDDNLHREGWLAGEERYPSGGGGGTWNAGDQKVRSGVLALAKQVNDWKFHSVMVNRMTVRGEMKRVSIEYELIGYNLVRGSYNSANWTLATDKRNVIMPGVLTFKINNTAYGISRYEISLDNNLISERDTASGLFIREPVRNGKRTVQFGFDFLRYESNTFLDNLDNDTERYCSFKHVSNDYALGFYFSAFKFEKIDAPIAGSEIIRMKHQCVPYIPSSDQFASEWSNIQLKKNAEMVCMIIDDNSNNYLDEN